ncbi:MAG: hypothetical protein HQK55_04820 [Deltaproteobacteria bacterium]|nr:hypothetical protein [Deltaproteobacteria bacterium]
MKKIRADQLMVDQGLAETRSQARALIMAGQVLADGRPVEKAGQGLSSGINLVLKDNRAVYASRGGLKLAGALEDLGVKVDGLTALDVGASTGGFTDCLLKKGAGRVVAEGDILVEEDLPPRISGVVPSPPNPTVIEITDEGIDFNQMVSDFEDRLLIRALEKAAWVKNRAAQLLKINRTTLVEKLKKKGITAPND